MTSRRAFALLAFATVVLAACRPVALPNAPAGTAASSVLVDVNPDPAVTDERAVDNPDPFVLAVDPSYCDTGSGPPAACYYVYSTQVYFNITPVMRSSDLVHWQLAGIDSPADADPWPNGEARTSVSPWSDLFGHWAPAVLPRPSSPGARFVMWYAAQSHVDPTSGFHCLGVATADSPDGPFVDDATAPAYCQTDQGGTIDPSPFVDADGTPYLLYKTEGTSAIPTRLWISQLSADGRSVVPGTEHLLLENDQRPGSWEFPVTEAPAMVRTPSGLFLFYSAYYWSSPSYKIGVARCDTPIGPCRRIYNTPLVESRGAMLGPGGETPFVSASGQWYLAFHAWTSPNVGYDSGGLRSLRILPLSFPSGSPSVG